MSKQPPALRSRLVQVHELEERVQRAALAPDEEAREKQRALAAAEHARQELREYFAKGRRDAKQEREIVDRVHAAEQAANQRWADREAGARMAEGVARDELHAFVRKHFAEIAAELIPRAVDVQRRFDAARSAFAKAFAERQLLLDEWRGVVAPVGIPMDDLPPEDSLELPAPRALAPLAADISRNHNDDEKRSGEGG